jgi:hypothetical protein
VVGGVPRSVFSANWDRTVGEVQGAIAGLAPETLARTLTPGSDPRVTSRLVHQVSTPPFFNKVGSTSTVRSVYASEYVRTAIYKRFLFGEQFKLHMWLKEVAYVRLRNFLNFVWRLDWVRFLPAEACGHYIVRVSAG